MFEGFGPEKLLMLLLIVLVLFGGRRIPEIGGSIGKGIREFKRGMKDLGDSVHADEVAPASDARPMGTLPAAPIAAATTADAPEEPKRLLS